MKKQKRLPRSELKSYIAEVFYKMEGGKEFSSNDILQKVCKRAEENHYRTDGTEKEEVAAILHDLLFSHAVTKQPNGKYRLND